MAHPDPSGVDCHKHERVALRADCGQCQVVRRGHKPVAGLYETRHLLSDIIILDTLIALVGEAGLDHAPLVVPLLDILPVVPRLAFEIAHVVKEAVHHVEIALDAVASGTCLTHPQPFAGPVHKGVELRAAAVVGIIRMRVPLSDHIEHSAVPVGIETANGTADPALIRRRNHRIESRRLKYRVKHLQKRHLRRVVEMASLLTAVAPPVVGKRFIERLEGTELNPVFILIMLAHIHKIMRELLVIFRFEIVFPGIVIACRTTAVSHVIWSGIAECLKYGVGAFLLDFKHYFALCGVAAPDIAAVGRVFEAFHLGTLPLAAAHVVGVAVAVLRVVTAAYVIAEHVIIQSRRAHEPVYDFVNLVIAPLTAHVGPPAQRHAPAFVRLAQRLGIEQIAHGLGLGLRLRHLRHIPQMFRRLAVLVAIHHRP